MSELRMQIKYVIQSARDYGEDVTTEIGWEDLPGGFISIKEFNAKGTVMESFNISPERARLVAQAILQLTEMR